MVDNDPFCNLEKGAGERASELERTLVLVPHNTQDRLIHTKQFVSLHGGNFAVFEGEFKLDRPNKVIARCDEAFEQMDAHKETKIAAYEAIKRIILFETGVYVFNSINSILGQNYLRQTFREDSDLREGFGISESELSSGDLFQLDYFMKNVWRLSTQPEFGRAHQSVTLLYNHIKSQDEGVVYGRIGTAYVHNLSQLLTNISPENDEIVELAGIGFRDFYMRHLISDHFEFPEEHRRLEGSSKIFNPVTLYVKLKSTAIRYAQETLDALSRRYITSDPDSVHLPSGMNMAELVSRTRFE